MEKVDEPPSGGSSHVTIGRDSRGNWVAQESNGLFGGLFVSRTQAMKYALFENGHHPEGIIVTTDIIELDMRRKAAALPPIVEASFDRSRAA
jgi:hypothetical protein